MEQKRYTLPRSRMIKRRSDFQCVYQKGRSVAGRRMILYVLRDPRVAGKVGFAAGKKLGCAAVRSRTKRLLREAYRSLQHELRGDVGILLIGRAGLADGKMQDAAEDLRRLIRRAGIFADGAAEKRRREHG
ncbi:ribonuclease P protein component [uncultured Selenomonas sp.]|uniref:ribonuclease P protein component n=1 Tax=uncultured Selenomonas sp. TaxID=159275 RepID=UPI0028F03039|nr:ribonuclease P protein component [uncultured Selenomonas sp.]